MSLTAAFRSNKNRLTPIKDSKPVIYDIIIIIIIIIDTVVTLPREMQKFHTVGSVGCRRQSRQIWAHCGQ